MITVSGVSFAHGARTLFRDVSFQIPPGRRVALVGGNGVGKTTLLELVVGLRRPDSGSVARPREARVGYLPQGGWAADDEQATRARGVLDEVLRGAGEVVALEPRLRELEQRIADADDGAREDLLARYGHEQQRFEQLGGFHVETEAHRVLAGLGFAPGDGARRVGELSGGWQMRVGLARMLLSRPDLLVLDEPTNHLDLDTIRWLEQTLVERSGGALFVSHDRDFIDAVAERVVDVSAGTATEYVVDPALGAFADFVTQREVRVSQLTAAKRQQDREIAAQERFIERFRYKNTKARQVQSRVKALERTERIEVPDHRQLVARFGFPPPARSGRVVAELDDVAAGFGDVEVLAGVDLTLERGWKVGVIGPNGAGKTTLLRLLAGTLAPRRGEVRHGHNVDLALFTQHQIDTLELRATVLEEFRTALSSAQSSVNHRSMLGAFGFGGASADQRVASLSGGELTRLALAKLMAQPVNLLCLDEPTNHLDIASRDVLEDALLAYPGTIVLVTHDRHVIRAVADHIVEVRDGGLAVHDGGYEDLLERRAGGPHTTRPTSRRPGPPEAGDEPQPRSRDVRKRTEAEQRNRRHRATGGIRAEVARLETALEDAEGEVATLTRQLAEPGAYDDNERVKALVAAHGTAKERASDLMRRWEQAQAELDMAEADLEQEADS